MPRFLSLSLCVGLWMPVALSQQSTGADAPSKQERTKNYAELISQLVSPNKEPMTRNEANSSVKFPAAYDVKAQKRIHAARQVLHDNIEDALPFLVKALDDKRYCMTIDWAEGDGYYNESVGSICRDVIVSHLEVYRDRIRFSDSGHWNRYNYPISKKWWETRKSRSLAELQVEAIQWAIERRMAEPKQQISKVRKDEVADLQKRRAEIAKSGKPAKSTGMLRMVTSDK